MKEVRIILLYKAGTKRKPNNWRPITISSSVQRLHHNISTKLDALIPLNYNQREFRKIDGTLANAMLVETFIIERRAARKEMTIVLFDITKAFDTVDHRSFG